MKAALNKVSFVILVVTLLLATAGMIGAWQAGRLLQSMDVHQLEYRIKKLGWQQLYLDEASLIYQMDSVHQVIHLNDAVVRWEWASWFSLRLLSVDVARLQWAVLMPDEHTKDSIPTTADKAFTLPEQWEIPDALPAHIHVENFILTLPCPSADCDLMGSIDVKTTQPRTTFHLRLGPVNTTSPDDNLQLTADYQVQQGLPHLSAHLMMSTDMDVELQTHLRADDQRYWDGKLTGSANYPAAWFVDALAQWNIFLSHEWAESLQEPVSIQSEWDLALAPLMNIDASEWYNAFEGQWRLDAQLTAPIKIQSLGEFSGELSLDLIAAKGQLERYQMSADIKVAELVVPPSLTAMGVQVERLELTAHSQVDADVTLTNLPLRFTARTQGELQSEAQASVLLNIANRHLTLEQLQITASAKQLLPVDDIVLHQGRVALQGHGYWQDDKFSFTISAPSEVQADIHASALSIEAKASHFKTEQLTLTGALIDGGIDWGSAQLDTLASLTIAQLHHPQLHAKPWRWQGEFKGALDDFALTGDLNANQSLRLAHQVKRNAKQLNANWQMADIFFLAGNPFADLVVAWPSLLSLTQGKVNATGQLVFDLEKNNLLNSQTEMQFSDVAGIYDTVAFQGLSSALTLATRDQALTAATDEIRIRQINKGFVLGPLVAAGSYKTNWDQLTNGTFSLAHLSGNVMGGKISTPAQVFDLRQDKQAITLALDDIDLGMLLQQHPSTELSGSGRISGTVPIEIDGAGVSVAKGMIAAKPPGGQLQYHSERADTIARSQPSMKLITDALDDFHYTVLASEVSYDVNGKLLLAVRLEGKNPRLEKGRPVHFNINLEEDLPAMIASIQLSNQISDLVKKRLQERLQKRTTPSRP